MIEDIVFLENIIDERNDLISALELQLKKLLAPPEQEPVAWHYIYDDGITVRERVTECIPLGEHYTITPLYTAPPKREPLSESEIAVIWGDSDYDVAVVRRIEKAHGIGVDDE